MNIEVYESDSTVLEIPLDIVPGGGYNEPTIVVNGHVAEVEEYFFKVEGCSNVETFPKLIADSVLEYMRLNKNEPKALIIANYKNTNFGVAAL